MATRKAAHEAFISGHGGCTLWELWLHLAMPCLTAGLADQLTSLLRCHGNFGRLAVLIGEVALMFGSAVMQLTLMADWVPLMAVLAASLTLWLALRQGRKGACERKDGKLDDVGGSGPRRLFKDFQALLLLQTSVAILAVDFPAMPRRLAKTETSGASPMDVGAPAFAFSSGLFAAAAMGTQPRCHGNSVPSSSSSSSQRWRRALLSALPLALLGFARTLAVKTAAYQEHVTEYGLHWNFFLTLACLRAVWPLAADKPGLWAVCLAACHLLCVLPMGGADFLVLEPHLRRDRRPGEPVWLWLLTANREGLLSLPPYMSLFCCGAALARRCCEAWQTTDRRRRLLAALAVGAFLPPALVGAACPLGLMQPPSRLLFNASFLLLCLGACCLGLFLLTLRSCFFGGGSSSSSALLDAVGASALPFFLLSNLLTGAVNLAVDTVAVSSHLAAVGILCAYSACLLGCLPVCAAARAWLAGRRRKKTAD